MATAPGFSSDALSPDTPSEVPEPTAPVQDRRHARLRRRPKITVWPVAFALFVTTIVVPVFLFGVFIDHPVAAMVLTQLAAPALVLAWRAGSPSGWKERLALGRPQVNFKVITAMVLGQMGDLILSFSIASQLDGARTDLDPLFELMASSKAALLVGWLGFALIPAFCEEVFYRGFAQSRFVARWGTVRGITLAGLLFAVMHGPSALAILPGSLWFGFVAWRTKSTWSSVALHAGHNGLLCAGFVLYQLFGDPAAASEFFADANESLEISAIAAASGGALGALLLAFAVRTIWRNTPTPSSK